MFCLKHKNVFKFSVSFLPFYFWLNKDYADSLNHFILQTGITGQVQPGLSLTSVDIINSIIGEEGSQV